MPGVIEQQGVRVLERGVLLAPDPSERQLSVSRGIAESPPVSCATPDHLVLGNLNNPCFRLRAPLRLTITREGPLVIASAPDLEEFGYGSHLSAAVEDFRQTLIELYKTLKTEQEHLGPDLAELWQRIQGIILER